MTTHASRRGQTRHHRREVAAIPTRMAALLVGLFVALSIAAPAFAHAELVSSDPEDSAVLETPPTRVTLTFSEGLDAGKSSFKLLGAGTTIGTGRAAADGATTMTMDGLTLAAGAFEIQWTSAAMDGHIDRGTLAFTVAPASSSAPVSAGAAPAPSGDAGTSAAPSSTDVLIPIVVALMAVGGVGAYVLRRSRRA